MTTRTGAGRAKYSAAVLALLILLPLIFAAVIPTGVASAAEERTTVAGLISAALKVSPSLAQLEAVAQMVPRGFVLTGTGQLRPAADLGAWASSRGYGRVTSELGDALAEDAAPDATTRDWTRCYERGNGAAVICPDGYIEVN